LIRPGCCRHWGCCPILLLLLIPESFGEWIQLNLFLGDQLILIGRHGNKCCLLESFESEGKF
jgi:hypothetical protein